MYFKNKKGERAVFLLIFIIASYLFFFYSLGEYSLKEPDEGRYAEIPREMVEKGDYIVPHLNYVRYFEKPPLLYWITSLSYKIFGIDEWSFRFPNALVAFLCVIITYFSTAKRFNSKTALLSSLLLMSSFGLFAMSHIVTTDMLFTFLLFASLLAFFEFYCSKKQFFLYCFFTALALAVLTKGLVAIILLGATIFIFLLIEKKIFLLKKILSVKGLLLFLAISAPWFIVMCIKEKEFFQFFFVDQHFMRFITTKHSRSGPLYYFLPVLFGGLFPWSIFIPRAVLHLWHIRDLRLFFIWSAVVFCFFSISGSKLPPYILPVFPALSIILGYLFNAEWEKPVHENREIIIYGVFFVCTAAAGLICGTNLFAEQLKLFPDISSIAPEIRGLSLGLSGVSIIILFLLFFKKACTFRSLFYILGGFSLFVTTTLMLHADVIDQFNTTKKLAQIINERKTENYSVMNYGSYNQTLTFYIQGKTYLVNDTGELEMGSKYPDARELFLNQDDFIRMFKSDYQVWVIFKAKRLTQLKELGVIDKQEILCQDNRCLISNKDFSSKKD